MTEAIVIAIITQTALIIVSLIQNRNTSKKTASIAADAKVARDQTANTHNTNLRDDVDVVIGSVQNISKDIRDVKLGLELQGADIVRIGQRLEAQHRDDEFLEETIDRARIAQERALRQAIEDRTKALQDLRDELPILVNQHIDLTRFKDIK